MRSQLRYTFLLASALVACGWIMGCSGEPEKDAGKMDTGKMSGPMDKADSGKMSGPMDKMEPDRKSVV